METLHRQANLRESKVAQTLERTNQIVAHIELEANKRRILNWMRYNYKLTSQKIGGIDIELIRK